MGILVTTGSLKQYNACLGAIDFFTGSFCIEGNQWYSGSNNEAYFEENIIYPFTCSNSNEISWLSWAADTFKVTGSFYNAKTNTSYYYHRTVFNLDDTISGSVSGSE